ERLWRALARAHLGEHAPAAADARELCDGPSSPADVLLGCARVFAVASAAAGRDAALPEPERAGRARDYADRAVGALEELRTAGRFATPADLADLKNDPHLAPLHGHPGFQELLALLGGKA